MLFNLPLQETINSLENTIAKYLKCDIYSFDQGKL